MIQLQACPFRTRRISFVWFITARFIAFQCNALDSHKPAICTAGCDRDRLLFHPPRSVGGEWGSTHVVSRHDLRAPWDNTRSRAVRIGQNGAVWLDFLAAASLHTQHAHGTFRPANVTRHAPDDRSGLILAVPRFVYFCLPPASRLAEQFRRENHAAVPPVSVVPVSGPSRSIANGFAVRFATRSRSGVSV